MDPKQIHLSHNDVHQSTLLFGVLAILLMIPLLLILENQPVTTMQTWTMIASALFWGTIALIFIVGYWDLYYAFFYPRWMLFIVGYWDLYYAFFYPRWMRWASPFLTPVLYALLAMGILQLAGRSSGAVWLWWLLLGATEGFLEHVLGIYGLRILERVPWLDGLRSGPLLLFAFFEYLFYWTLVGWLALGLRAGANWLQSL